MINEGMRYYIHAEVFKTMRDAETMNQVVTKVCDLIEEQSQKMESGWVRCDERLPTEADEDDYGLIHAWHEDGHAMLLQGYDSFRDTRFTHWKHTGFKYPQPPEDLK